MRSNIEAVMLAALQYYRSKNLRVNQGKWIIEFE